MIRLRLRHILACGLGATAFAHGPMWATAQSGEPTPKPTGVPVLRPDLPATPAKPADADGKKMLSINFDNKPWTDVVDWFGRESGLVWVGSIKVPGSFTVKARPDQQFTIPQVVDLMNEQLLIKKFLLIRRGMSFTILPADEKIDPTLIPRIELSELPDRGRTEIVQVVAPVKTLANEQTVPELEKMLSPFGAVTPLTGANHILLQDTAGNVARILNTINIAELENAGSESLNYPCKYVRAAQAADTLRGLLTDKDTEVTGGPEESDTESNDSRYSRDRDRDRRYYPPPTPQKENVVNVTVDNRTNSVLVTGSALKISLAKKILSEIDVAKDGQMPVIIGPPELRTYPVPVGTAEAVAKTLQEAYQMTSPSLRAMPIPNSSQIMVYASPGEHMEILAQLKGTEGVVVSDAKTELIPLSVLDATETAATLARIFPPSESGVLIEAQTSGPVVGLFVKGTTAQIADVKEAIKALGESGGLGGGTSGMQIIPVTNGNAAVLAEGLAEMMRKMGKEPVRVVAPGGVPYEPKPAVPAPAPQPRSQPERVPVPGSSSMSRPGLPATQLVSAQLVDPEQPAEGPPITITVAGDRLLISGGTPESRALLTQMARLYTQVPKGEDQFEIIRLRNASAVEAAKVISEVFNGPPQKAQAQQGGGGGGRSSRGGGGFGGFGDIMSQFLGGTGGDGATLPGGATPGRIRVVAEPSSNSLIVVKASPLDLFMIRKLLENAIEANPEGSAIVQRTYIIGPLKNADAVEVAATIREVYAAQIGPDPDLTARLSVFRPTPQSEDQKAAPLSVGVDERSNSLIVMCSEPMFADVSDLVEHLDTAAKGNTQVIKLVPLKGIDPALVQQTIDAIQGTGAQPAEFDSGSFGGFFGGGGSSRSGRSRGSRRSDRGTGMESPINFDYRGMDAPSAPNHVTPALYDPLEDTRPNGPVVVYTPVGLPDTEIRPVQATQPAPLPGEPPAAGSGDVQSPRGPITTVPLPELGGVIIRADDQRDLELVLDIIKRLQEAAAGAEPRLEIVPLKYADPGSITSKLDVVFSRVRVGLGGNVAPSATDTTLGYATVSESVYILPLPRFRSLLVVAPKARFDDVLKEIDRFDKPNAESNRPHAFRLKRASAQIVSQQIQQFWDQRYPDEPLVYNQLRITFDLASNTVFVQASPADLTDIGELIDVLDSAASEAVNDVRIFRLQNALAEELAAVIIQSLTSNVVNPITQNGQGGVQSGGGAFAGGATGTLTGGGGGLGGGLGGLTGTSALGSGGGGGGAGGGLASLLGGGQGQTGGGGQNRGGGGRGQNGGNFGGGQAGGGLGGNNNGLNAVVAQVGGTSGGGLVTKTNALRFFSNKDGQVVETGFLEDVHIIPNARINALVVAAPTKTMRLIESMIENLDVVAAAQSFVNVFTLKTADATQTAVLLQQLFAGQAGSTGATGGGGAGG